MLAHRYWRTHCRTHCRTSTDWIPYGRYLRWVWPLLALLAVLTVVVLIAGAALS